MTPYQRSVQTVNDRASGGSIVARHVWAGESSNLVAATWSSARSTMNRRAMVGSNWLPQPSRISATAHAGIGPAGTGGRAPSQTIEFERVGDGTPLPITSRTLHPMG